MRVSIEIPFGMVHWTRHIPDQYVLRAAILSTKFEEVKITIF